MRDLANWVHELSLSIANAAMGLGLEMWSLPIWFSYVAAMLLLEAWLIGRWLDLSWGRSLWFSLLANAFTGVLCGVAGFGAPFLHQAFVGTRINPNPFLNSVVLLLIFAIPSALLELFFWQLAKAKSLSAKVPHGLGWRALLVHIIGIPVGLAILLIPERPYRPLESLTRYARRVDVEYRLVTDLNAYLAKNGRIPKSTTIEAMLAEVPPADGRGPRKPGAHLAFYTPEFHRFDTGEAKRHPHNLNRDLAGRSLADLSKQESDTIWYITPSTDIHDYGRGILIDLRIGEFRSAQIDDLPATKR